MENPKRAGQTESRHVVLCGEARKIILCHINLIVKYLSLFLHDYLVTYSFQNLTKSCSFTALFSPLLCFDLSLFFLAARPPSGPPHTQKRLRHTHVRTHTLRLPGNGHWSIKKSQSFLKITLVCMCACASLCRLHTCLTEDSKKTQNLPKTTRHHRPPEAWDTDAETPLTVAGWLCRHTDKGLTSPHVCSGTCHCSPTGCIFTCMHVWR